MIRNAATRIRRKVHAPFLVAVFCLVPLGPIAAAGEVVVVVNESVTEDGLDRKDLQRIYLGKRSTWRDKSAVVPVILKEGPVHEEFVEEVVGRSIHRFANYWRQMVFTGKGTPPKSFATEAEVVAFVKETPGAVGYVSPGTATGGVKVFAVE